MTTATLAPSLVEKVTISRVENYFRKENRKKAVAHLGTAKKHYLLINLEILLESAKNREIGDYKETASSILRKHQFIMLTSGFKNENSKPV